MDRNEIIDAYIFLRENNHSISDSTLDFIKDASLCAYDAMSESYCKRCEHNGDQMRFPGACTGCGSKGEKRNFKLKEHTSDSATVDSTYEREEEACDTWLEQQEISQASPEAWWATKAWMAAKGHRWPIT